MSKVCGFGAGIPLLKTNTSSTFSIASYPSSIQCKTDKKIHKQKSESHIQSVSRVPPSQIHIQSTSGIPRRQAVSFLGLSLLLNLSQPAQAKDIPLFGIKKKLEKVEQQLVEGAQKVEQEVAQEAQILVKEGEQEAEKVTEKIKEAAVGLEEKAGLFQGPNGSFAQAGIVAGVELVGVLVASSVVNSIVGPEPSK